MKPPINNGQNVQLYQVNFLICFTSKVWWNFESIHKCTLSCVPCRAVVRFCSSLLGKLVDSLAPSITAVLVRGKQVGHITSNRNWFTDHFLTICNIFGSVYAALCKTLIQWYCSHTALCIRACSSLLESKGHSNIFRFSFDIGSGADLFPFLFVSFLYIITKYSLHMMNHWTLSLILLQTFAFYRLCQNLHSSVLNWQFFYEGMASNPWLSVFLPV